MPPRRSSYTALLDVAKLNSRPEAGDIANRIRWNSMRCYHKGRSVLKLNLKSPDVLELATNTSTATSFID